MVSGDASLNHVTVNSLSGNVTGNFVGDVTGNLIGDVTGNLVGNLIGDVTGNLVGNVTGDVTGNLVGNVTGNLVGNVTGNLVGDTVTSDSLTVNGNADITGTINGGHTTVDSLTTTGAVSGGATSVTSLSTAGTITGGHTTATSLTTQGGLLTAGIAVVESLDVRNPTYSPTNPLSYGYITGGVTSVTELKTNTISPATGQVNTTFPYDVHCRDMNVNVKLVTDFIVAPNGSNVILINNAVRIPSTLYVKTIISASPTYPYSLTLQAGFNPQSDIVISQWTTAYHANAHFFYNGNGANFPNHPSYGVFFNGTVYWQSDDRLKHNEVDVSNALSTIRKLNAQKYQKTSEPKEADFNGELTEPYVEETGFIAQDVMQIPELAYLVSDQKTALGKQIYYLNYNDIFVVNVQAVKELDAIVQSQQTEIDSLKARLTALEKLIN